jgi:hypothetical protein
MNNTKILWSAVVVVAIIAVFGLFNPTSKTIYQTNTVKGIDSTNFTNLGLGINDSYVQIGGRRQSLVTGTSTPCSILSPNATTTVAFADLNILTSTSTATYWQLATSTTAYATTSVMATYSVSSGISPVLTYDSPVSSIDSMIAPNTYLVWKVGGVTIADATKLTGTCQVIFNVI